MLRVMTGEQTRRSRQHPARARGKAGADRPRGRRRLDVEVLEGRVLLSGTWASLAHGAPSGIGTMELLTDGTVMAQGSGVSSAWYRLTPSSSGSYVNGSWSSLASMSTPRLYTATNVLKDGRVFELGGEYSGSSGSETLTNTGEIYDPVSNTWTSIPNFPQGQFGDDPTMLLPDGRVLAGYLSGPQTYIYDPVANTWSQAATKQNSDRSDEETWIKLPDDSILAYDVFSPGTAQRYIPSLNQWVATGSVPVALTNSSLGYELGPACLLPDGRAFYVGANGNTAFYTPSTDTWTAGPTIPNGQGADDAPGAMLPNGDVLLAVDTPLFKAPTRIYEFNPTTDVYTDVTPTSPNLSGTSSYNTRMLMLPSGEVLFSFGASQLYVYTPSGSPQSSWQPTITGIAATGSNYTLTGTQINGLSAGASYGDDAEMDTNYPIIELNNGAGSIYFARTFNWSSTGVATGSTPVSTDFSVPSGLPGGTYSVTVIANGIASAPFSYAFGGGTGSTGSGGSGGSGGSADLAVTDPGPGTVNEGDTITYTLTVTNNGPNDATAAVLTDTLGANLRFVSATTGQGTFTQSGGVVTFSLGTVASGHTVTATVTAQALEDGNLSDTASIISNISDPNASNNTTTVTTTVAEAPIVVSGPITLNGKKFNNTRVATFTHANGVEPASAFIATINWGDGTTSTGKVVQSGSGYIVTGSHTYPNNGSHIVATTVTENDQPKGLPHARATGVPGPGGTSSVPVGPGSTRTLSDQPAILSILGTIAGPDGTSDAAATGVDDGRSIVVPGLKLASKGRRHPAVPQVPLASRLS